MIEQSNHSKQVAQSLQLSLNKDAKVQDKYQMWEKEDEALYFSKEANLTQSKCEHLLQSALTCKPDYQEVHALLAEIYCERHQDAVQRRDILEEARFEELLMHHTKALHNKYEKKDKIMDYLEGKGHISIGNS